MNIMRKRPQKVKKEQFYLPLPFTMSLLTQFKMDLSGAAHGWRGGGGGGRGVAKSPLPKINPSYPTKIKLCSYTLPKKEPKNI